MSLEEITKLVDSTGIAYKSIESAGMPEMHALRHKLYITNYCITLDLLDSHNDYCEIYITEPYQHAYPFALYHKLSYDDNLDSGVIFEVEVEYRKDDNVWSEKNLKRVINSIIGFIKAG